MYVAALHLEVKSSHLLQIKRKMQTKCIDFYMHLFDVTRLLTYMLITSVSGSLKKHSVLRKQA